MNARDILKAALLSTKELLNWYLSDLEDADLKVRPVPGANNIAWQLGHLISAEPGLLNGQLPGVKYPELPATFKHYSGGKDNQEPPDGYLSKAAYLEWFNKLRDATLAAVEKVTEADLDRENTGPLKHFAPKLGDLLILICNHTLMHAGQFTVVRRALGKKVLF